MGAVFTDCAAVERIRRGLGPSLHHGPSFRALPGRRPQRQNRGTHLAPCRSSQLSQHSGHSRIREDELLAGDWDYQEGGLHLKQLTTSRRGQGTTNRPKETQPAGRTCVTWRPHYQDFKRLPREEEVAVLRTLLETFVSRAWCLRQHAGYPHVGWRNPVVGCERLPQARKRQREDGEADPLDERARDR